MNDLAYLSAAVVDAEQHLLERRRSVRYQAAVLAGHARRRLASPVALLAAAGAGFVLGSKTGRRGFGKLFAAMQLALAALSAVKAAK